MPFEAPPDLAFSFAGIPIQCDAPSIATNDRFAGH
jgi:hypothetical protein